MSQISLTDRDPVQPTFIQNRVGPPLARSWGHVGPLLAWSWGHAVRRIEQLQPRDCRTIGLLFSEELPLKSGIFTGEIQCDMMRNWKLSN